MRRHNSPPIPSEVFGRKGFPKQLVHLATATVKARSYERAHAHESDLIFRAYNATDPAAREAMDQVFVWFTGLTLASMAAIIEARHRDVQPESYADIVAQWRRAVRE